MIFNSFDYSLMSRLIDAARLRKGYTLPNPVTAAAVVKNGVVLSEGVHQRAGELHAEGIALERCGSEGALGSTLYVTLEPCTHWGKQPPCVERIIASGVSEVVYAVSDPNPKVHAHPAKAILEKAGIVVRHGLLEQEALLLNESFFKFHFMKQPFVTLKAGMSIDGKIALSNGESKYITSSESRKRVHQLRREHHALLIGINTIATDNPLLSIREENMPAIERKRYILVLDVSAKLSEKALFFDENPHDIIILLTGKKTKVSSTLEKRVQVWRFDVTPEGKIAWPDILRACYDEGIQDVLIEGGTGVYSSALEADVVDKVVFFLAPKVFGGENDRSVFSTKGFSRLSDVHSIHDMEITTLGPDIHITGYLTPPRSWFIF